MSSIEFLTEIKRIKASSSKKESLQSHFPLQCLTASTKKQSKRDANALATPSAFGRGITMSGIGQSSLSHWTRAKAASASGSSLTLEHRWSAGGVVSKTKAEGNGSEAFSLQRRQISSSISSKQWRHLPAGSGGAHSSQHSGQKRRVSQGSLHILQSGGKIKSSHVLNMDFEICFKSSCIIYSPKNRRFFCKWNWGSSSFPSIRIWKDSVSLKITNCFIETKM